MKRLMTKEEAIQLAEQLVAYNYGDEWAVATDDFIEKNDVFVFFYNSKKYIETRAFKDKFIGTGTNIIDKKSGKIYPYASAYSYEEALEYYRQEVYFCRLLRIDCPDFEVQKSYCIWITAVDKIDALIHYLMRQSFSYMQPEVDGEYLRENRRTYTRELLEKRLSQLPVVFSNIEGKNALKFTEINQRLRLGSFRLEEYIPRKRENNIHRASEEDYETEW